MSWEKRINWITLHHSGTYFGEDQDFIDEIVRIRNYHITKNWGTAEYPVYAPDIVYHTIINPNNGKVCYSNDINSITWHDSRNIDSLGVLVLGDGRVQSWNDNIEEGLRHIQDKYKLLGNIGWRAHRDVKATECPGDLYYNGFLKWKRGNKN